MSSTTMSATTFTPSSIFAPDLTGFSFDVLSSGPINAGGSLTIDYRLQNSGLAAGPFTVSFYLSTDNTIRSSDFLLGSVGFNGLPASNISSPFTNTFTLPGVNNTFWNGDRTYFIGMIVDSSNAVLESNENNNASVGASIDYEQVTIINTQSANLVGSAFDVTTGPLKAGSSFTINYDIRNLGGGSASSFDVSFYISSNNFISSLDVLLGTTTISGLSGNTTSSYTSTLTLPSVSDSFWSGSRTYYIGMIVDSNNTVSESNESDNSNRGLSLDYDDVVINTLIVGTNDEDTFNGTASGELYAGLDDDDLIRGNGGDDHLSGNRGDDTIFGGTGQDILMGQRGDDDLYGGLGNDTIHGGRGDDVLVGVDPSAVNPGEGEIDILTGGFGADEFHLGDALGAYYTSSTGIVSYALITDFDITQDVIQLQGSAADYQLGTPAGTGFPTGIGIYRGATELIAIVQGVTSLNFSSSAFVYV